MRVIIRVSPRCWIVDYDIDNTKKYEFGQFIRLDSKLTFAFTATAWQEIRKCNGKIITVSREQAKKLGWDDAVFRSAGVLFENEEDAVMFKLSTNGLLYGK